MAHELNDDFPLGGLNSDDEPRRVPNGDYLSAKNIRNAINAFNKAGTLTNVKGNLEITKYTLPYNANVFPTGRNKVIGSVEDPKYNTVVYFVWNSEGKHQILRYYRDLTSPANPYGEIQQVMQYDFGWTKRTRIESANIVYGTQEAGADSELTGDLLYWCDKIPKAINLTRANICTKLKSWKVLLPVTCNLAAIPVVTFKDFSGATVYTVGITLSDPTDRETIISDIATQINADANSPVTAEACDCKLYFTEKTIGTVWTIEWDIDQILTPALNWYGGELVYEFFDRCKYPPLQAPRGTFEQDANYEPNYVQKKVFQFRLEYNYHDLERSVLGVWSQIPINNLGCDGTSGIAYNYIDVDFNDTSIPVETKLVLLSRIRFIARELNTGLDRAIIELEPCDFLDYDYTNNVWVCHYKFYNDQIPRTIDAATAAKLFDNVPLETNDERFVKNRLNEGGILEGYDAPDCVDAKIQMEFGEQPNPTFYKITGRIRVFAPKLDNTIPLPPQTTEPSFLQSKGSISYDSALLYGGKSYPFFGGYFIANNASDLIINSDFAFNKKRQYLPEGGWPVYAAGTNYLTVSKQIPLNNVSQRADGSFDVTGSVNQDLVKQAYLDAEDIYSTFELMVPAGEYVIRLAHHWCSFGDKLAKGFMYNLSSGISYQKTSTYVWGVNDSPLGGGYKYNYEIKVTVTNSDVYIGEFFVTDLVFPNLADDSAIYPSHSGYLFDNFGQTDAISVSQGVTVERALVRNTVFNESSIYASYQQKITDHNGFFYTFPDVDFNSELTYANRFIAIQVSGDIKNTGTQYYEDVNGKSALDLLFAELITPSYPHDPIPSHLEIILPTDNPDARLESSTFVTGLVADSNGNSISNVVVLITHGRYGYTATDGTYSVLIWGDMGNTPPFAAPVNKREDYIVFFVQVACQPEYPSGHELFFTIDGSVIPTNGFGSNTTSTPPPYSPTAKYNAGGFIINENNNPSVKARKRGGKYIDGIRCYDVAGRLCSVVSVNETYIPFITEDIGKYSIEDFSGTIYPANTFRYGKPSLKWVLAPTTVFPSWVKTFQWMRTKNGIYGRYLQWVANQVTYLSSIAQGAIPEIQTNFQNSDAVAIKISLSNITAYAAQNPDSQISYQYQAGDRLRLIANRTLINYSRVVDFTITSFDSTTQSVLIKTEGFDEEILSGTLFEIFNAKSVASEEQQIFYETGEVVNVNNGIPESFSGIFSEGDTYWRGRLITVNDEATKYAAAYPVVIEDASVSDFYPSEAQDIGRIGIIDPAFKQVYAPTKIRCSNQFIPSTAINGLSSFEELNQKEFGRENGDIQRVLKLNNTLLVVMSEREISNYIQVVTIQNAGVSGGVLSVTDQYYGTEYPHARRLGTDLPSSVLINDGTAFGFQSKRGQTWRYQGDGEVTISEAKMINYFYQLELDGVSDATAVYHRKQQEYILTVWRNYKQSAVIRSIMPLVGIGVMISVAFPEGAELPEVGSDFTMQYLSGGNWPTLTGEVTEVDSVNSIITVQADAEGGLVTGANISATYSLPETISFYNGEVGPNKDRWITNFDFTPEKYEQIGSEIVMFKDGRAWLADVNPLYNNFFGVQYETSIAPVFNDYANLNKVWWSLWMLARQDNNACNWRADRVYNTYGQLSRLKAANFVKKENVWYIPFLRDLTDTSVSNPITSGRNLRSPDLVVEMQNDYTGEITLFGWRANLGQSSRTIK